MAKSKSKIPMDRRSYSSLTSKQRYNRDQSLRALRMMRREDKSIAEASKAVGLPQSTVVRSIKSCLVKIGNTWQPKQHDTLIRPPMAIYTNGERKWIDVADSRTASLIGRYHSMRGIFIERLDPRVLEPFIGVVVQDMYGNKYLLDTDPEVILETERRRPEGEPYEVYKYGG